VPEPSVDLRQDLADLVSLAARPEPERELMRRGLDWLGRVAPYDLATLFVLEDDVLRATLARGAVADERVASHTIALERFPSIREVLESRRARIFAEHDHRHGDGDPFDDVYGFPPGHACMVVPLCAGEERVGILTLDRRVCEPYAPEVVNLVEVYGQLLAVALRNARVAGALRRLERHAQARAEVLERDRVADPLRILAESRSPAVRSLVERARAVAGTETPVLILGETGTGKEQLARVIHGWSRRAEGPFVAVNCAAIAPSLLESELFGHVKGAFTGAVKDRPGRLQIANGGTLFLDEVGELPTGLQAKLLRVLQEGSFEPVGSDRTLRIDARILAATNVDLDEAVRAGAFRADLYFRLSVFPLRLPALRERPEDLRLVCEVLLADLGRRLGRPRPGLSDAALDELRAHPWLGNLRELSNVLERALILQPGGVLGPGAVDLPRLPPPAPGDSGEPERDLIPLHELERRHVARVLRATAGKIYGPDGAAAILGLKPSTLQSRMKKLGLERRAVLAPARAG
jgi:transcriptional regulator with GAF, ATPase, and Fis domain